MSGQSDIVIVGIALLTVFLCVVTALKYSISNRFIRARVIMTLFVVFVVVTMSFSFWEYITHSLIYIITSIIVGMIVGHTVGVEAAKKKLTMQGLGYYMEHIAHLHFMDFKNLTWWSFVNFYSVMIALFSINLIGLSTVIFKTEIWAVASLSASAFMLGTLIPYIFHLWSLPTHAHNK